MTIIRDPNQPDFEIPDLKIGQQAKVNGCILTRLSFNQYACNANSYIDKSGERYLIIDGQTLFYVRVAEVIENHSKYEGAYSVLTLR
jgi:hypothetical protein